MSKYSTNEMTSVVQQRVTVVGVDLGKTWIEVCGQAAAGKVCLAGKYKPGQFQALMAQLPACLVGLEACGRAHHWARVLQGYGHECQYRLKIPQKCRLKIPHFQIKAWTHYSLPAVDRCRGLPGLRLGFSSRGTAWPLRLSGTRLACSRSR